MVNRQLGRLTPTMAFLLILNILSLTINVHGCFKSSLYYRHKVRSRSHVFAPGEHQPAQLEHTTEGSGPLDARDFHHSIPNRRLVRVESPHIVFDSEEARWMSEGCRDRLLKLSTQIQNTWANQRVKLRVLRAWIKPPPKYEAAPTEEDSVNSLESNSLAQTQDNSLRFDTVNHQQVTPGMPETQTTHRPSPIQPSSTPPNTVYAIKREQDYQIVRTGASRGNQVVDMTPEMMVDDDAQDISRNTRFQSGDSSADYHRRHQPLPYWTPWRGQLHSPSQTYYAPSSYGLVQSGFRGPSKLYPTLIRLPREVQEAPLTNGSTNSSQSVSRRPRVFSRSVGSIPALMMNRNPYSPVNTMSQLRFEQWLHMRMEEFHYAGRAVDVQLITQSYQTPSNVNANLGVLAQIAYYVAHFDWCYFNRAGHVHCSVKPDASITSQWFGCFPGSMSVQATDGRLIPMKSLEIGDTVITRDKITGNLVPTQIVGFLHRDEHAWLPNLRIIYSHLLENESSSRNDSSSQLLLTPNHIVYIQKEINSQTKMLSTFAGNLKTGDTIFLFDPFTNTTKTAQVLSLMLITDWQPTLTGLYAPLTETGTLIVNNVFVSCFAQFTNEYLAFLVTWPLQLYYRLVGWLKLDDLLSSSQHGVHWYVKWIYQFTHSWLPGSLFYSQT